MVTRLFGNLMLIKLEQYENTKSPILVTLFGISMPVRLSQL